MTEVVAATGLGLVLVTTSHGVSPAWAMPAGTAATASSVSAVMTWQQLQDDRRQRAAATSPEADTFSVPGPRAALLDRLRTGAPRVGAAPTASAVSAVDGAITVQQGTAVRSLDPGTGAVTTQRVPSGYGLPVWGPAGDRLVAVGTGASPPAVFTDEDGASNTVLRGSDESVARPRVQPAWSPFGDAANVATSAAAGMPYTVNPSSLSWYFHTGGHTPFASPLVNSYGDVILTPWSATSGDPAVTRDGLTVTRASYPDGRQPHGDTVDVSTGTFTDFGTPAVGLAPGGSVLRQSPDYLALPVRLPATDGGAGLYVDHADGRGLVRVAPLGAVCPGTQVLFSPSHRQVAYLEAAGAVGQECSRTRLWVLTADGTRYDTGAARMVADSGTGAPFASLSWKARTPAPFAGRLGGADRIATAVTASRVLFAPASARTAVIAGAGAFPDALAATPLAGRLGGPLLMTGAASLDARVATELSRAVTPGATVYVAGGTAAVSRTVEQALVARGFQVVRLAGRDRFETAVAVARFLDAHDPRPETWPVSPIFVADGTAFADALVTGPAASHWWGTIVLSNGTKLPSSTRSYLTQEMAAHPAPNERWMNAIGGSASKAVDSDPSTAGTFVSTVGADRYQTAEYVAKTFFWAPPVAGMADGSNWPDAVTGGAAMAQMGAPLLLVHGSSVPAPTQAWWRVARSATDTVLAFGGATVLPDAAVQVAQRLGGSQSAMWGPDLL